MTLAPDPLDVFDPAAIDFELFGLVLEARRIRRGLSSHQLAAEACVEPDTVLRAAAGRNPGADAYAALAEWLGEDPEFFLKCDGAGEARRAG